MSDSTSGKWATSMKAVGAVLLLMVLVGLPLYLLILPACQSVEDARLPELVAQWEKIEALSQFDDPASLLPLLEDLVALARKARKANALLHCWS